MGGPKDGPIWDLEPHTAAKHEILKRYLAAWLPIMGRWNGRIVYIDGFAGPGEYSDGEPGSPLIALRAAMEHDYRPNCEFVCSFIENDQERFDHLQGLIAQEELPENIKAMAHRGRFDETMANGLDLLEEDGAAMAPAFVFIDPFGFKGTPMSLVQRIAGHARTEVLINFMYEPINRFVSHPSEKIQAHFDRLFGIEDWRQCRHIEDAPTRESFLHDLFLRQLEETWAYVRSFKMVDKGNRTEYFLFFCTNNQLGLEKMKDAMWKVDTDGRFEFSDVTAGDLQVQFDMDPDFGALKNAMLAEFIGKSVPVEAIKTFVLTKTPFRATHFKTQVLKPMEKEGAIQVTGKRGRPLSFPDGVTVHFEGARPS